LKLVKDELEVEATVILRGCKQSVKSTVRQQFVILNIVKDLGGQSSITLSATRSFALLRMTVAFIEHLLRF